ncbi:MAG: hypothetical protein KGZ82_02565 [Bacteroidales bacterium]|nr:hypothetical protein [Bacteroidales bacterium]
MMTSSLSKAEHFSAQLTSIVLHPLFIPCWTLIIMLRNSNFTSFEVPVQSQLTLIALVLTITFVLPALMIFLMYRIRMISSLTLQLRRERPAPILITAIFFYLTYYLLKQLNIAPVFSFYMLGGTILGLISLFITVYWKVSLHMLALGGSTAAIVCFAWILEKPMLPAITGMVLASGLTGFARLRLGAHHPLQIYGGYAIGYGIITILYLIVL